MIIEEKTPRILDSGARRTFDSGAVRDISDEKGRCDLLPLDAIAFLYRTRTDKKGAPCVLASIDDFVKSGNVKYLEDAIENFLLNDAPFGDCNWSTLFLEVAIHMGEGCRKYGERNWQLGINAKHFVDSGVRHYLKWLRGDNDEPHDRAFCWNMLCCIWTCVHKPELNDFQKDVKEE